MPNVDWKTLENTPWRLDVGSTMEEAMSSKENNKLFVTTDGQIVMNGEIMCTRPYFHIKDVDTLFSLNGKVSDDALKEALKFTTPNGEEVDAYENFIIFLYIVKQYGIGVIEDDNCNKIDVSLGYENGNSIAQFTMISPSYGSPRISYLVIDSGFGVCYSKKNASIINPSKLSEPDFKVCVRKALPMYPRKGMKYYFDNGVKYNLPKKGAFDNGFTFTVPNDGNTWVVSLLDDHNTENVIPNGTIIDKTNLLNFFPWVGNDQSAYTVITRKTNHPVLITILKDVQSVFEHGAFREVALLYPDELNFDCRKKYRRIVNGKVRYEIPLPDLQRGDEISLEYHTFKYRKKHLKFYGKNPPQGLCLDAGRNILLSAGGEEKKGYRMIRSSRYGTVYIARAIATRKRGKGKNKFRRYILSPKVKYYVDKNLKIKKRI